MVYIYLLSANEYFPLNFVSQVTSCWQIKVASYICRCWMKHSCCNCQLKRSRHMKYFHMHFRYWGINPASRGPIEWDNLTPCRRNGICLAALLRIVLGHRTEISTLHLECRSMFSLCPGLFLALGWRSEAGLKRLPENSGVEKLDLMY